MPNTFALSARSNWATVLTIDDCGAETYYRDKNRNHTEYATGGIWITDILNRFAFILCETAGQMDKTSGSTGDRQTSRQAFLHQRPQTLSLKGIASKPNASEYE